MENKIYFNLTDPIKLVKKASSVDADYGPFNSMSEALVTMNSIGLVGRQFILLEDNEPILYLFKGLGLGAVKVAGGVSGGSPTNVLTTTGVADGISPINAKFPVERLEYDLSDVGYYSMTSRVLQGDKTIDTSFNLDDSGFTTDASVTTESDAYNSTTMQRFSYSTGSQTEISEFDLDLGVASSSTRAHTSRSVFDKMIHYNLNGSSLEDVYTTSYVCQGTSIFLESEYTDYTEGSSGVIEKTVLEITPNKATLTDSSNSAYLAVYPEDIVTRGFLENYVDNLNSTIEPEEPVIFDRETDGLVPHPTTTTTTRYLREDGTWVVPTNTTYSAGTLAILNTGTETTNKIWSSKILNDWVAAKGYLTSYVNTTYDRGSSAQLTENTDDTVKVWAATTLNTWLTSKNYITSTYYDKGTVDMLNLGTSNTYRVWNPSTLASVFAKTLSDVEFTNVKVTGKINDVKLVQARVDSSWQSGTYAAQLLGDTQKWSDCVAVSRAEASVLSGSYTTYGATISWKAGDTLGILSVNPFAPTAVLTGGVMDNAVNWSRELAFTVNTVSITATAFYTSSLRKYKTNIKPFTENAEDLVNGLDIVTFDRVDDEQKNVVGVIADDTNPLFLAPEGNAVDLYKVCHILAKAVQELSLKVKQLENGR